MSEQIKPRLRLRTPGTKLRLALLLIVPLAIAFNLYVNNIAVSRDITGITFEQPVAWNYHSDTNAIPHTRRIHFSATGLVEAIRDGHGVPLFVITKFPADLRSTGNLGTAEIFTQMPSAAVMALLKER